MNTFLEVAKRRLKAAREKAREEKKILDALSQLPDGLINHEWDDEIIPQVDVWWDNVDLGLSLYKNKEQSKVDEIKEYLGKAIGFSFERVSHQYEEKFSYKGKLEGATALNKKIIINISSAPKPPNCQLNKTVTTEEVTKYEAICEDTGEII